MPHHRPLRPQPLTLSPLPTLVLLSLGASDDPNGPARLLPLVASRLAGLTGLPLAAIPDPGDASAALAQLCGQPGPWLAPLPLDPGLWLPGGSWAETLGAWRQPSLLAVPASQLATGLPAAATALLQRWNVPLAGLIQWEGLWDGASRRADGLPWLGRLGTAGQGRLAAAATSAAAGAGAAGAVATGATAAIPAMTTANTADAGATAVAPAGDREGEGPHPEEEALALKAALLRRCIRLTADLAAAPLA